MAILNVIGVQKSQGSVDGNNYNFSKVFAVARLQESDTRTGYAGIEVRGIPAISDKYLGFEFKPEGIPFEVQIEAVATGKGEFKDTITAMVPVAEMEQAKAAAEMEQAKAAAELEKSKLTSELPKNDSVATKMANKT